MQSNPRSVHNRASTPALISGTFGRSQGTSTSSSVEQDFETNGQEIFRKNLVEKGISNTVANLISNSRRSVTKSNYQSAWKKWVTWFSEGQINPVTCSINFVLNFLGNLFENKYKAAWRRGIVVTTTAQVHSTKSELRFCAGSNPACGMSEIRDGEDL